MEKTYTPKEISNISDLVMVYWERGDAHNLTELNGDEYEISLKARNLLESIKQMRTVPAEVREYLTVVQADDETLNNLEVMCTNDIKKFEESKK